MAAHVFSTPCVAADLWFVAPVFDPGVADGGVAAVAGASPATLEQVDTALALAEETTSRTAWGSAYKASMAVCLLAAHYLWLEAAANAESPLPSSGPSGGYAGVITSETVGPISRAYGASASGFVAGGEGAFADQALGTTPFGQRLIQLRRSVMVRRVF